MLIERGGIDKFTKVDVACYSENWKYLFDLKTQDALLKHSDLHRELVHAGRDLGKYDHLLKSGDNFWDLSMLLVAYNLP